MTAVSNLIIQSIIPSKVPEAFQTTFPTRRSMMLWGPPGISKSSLMRQYADRMNYAYVDIRLSQIEPVDLRGIPVPHVVDGISYVDWASPKVFPKTIDFSVVLDIYCEEYEYKIHHLNPKGVNGIYYVKQPEYEVKSLTPLSKAVIISQGPAGIVFKLVNENNEMVMGKVRLIIKGEPEALVALEEFNAAMQTVQQASYELLLDRRLGSYIVPEKVFFVAAGNRQTDGGLIFKLTSAVANRLVHVEVEPNYDDWLVWAISADIHPYVIGYLESYQQNLFNFDPKTFSRGFRTPRSWEFVSDILKSAEKENTSKKTLNVLVCGCIGEIGGGEFMTHLDLLEVLPVPMKILTGEITSLASRYENQIIYSMLISTAHKLSDVMKQMKAEDRVKEAKQLSEKNRVLFEEYTENFCAFLYKNIKPELTVAALRMAINSFNIYINKNLPSFQKIFKKHSDLFKITKG